MEFLYLYLLLDRIDSTTKHYYIEIEYIYHQPIEYI